MCLSDLSTLERVPPVCSIGSFSLFWWWQPWVVNKIPAIIFCAFVRLLILTFHRLTNSQVSRIFGLASRILWNLFLQLHHPGMYIQLWPTPFSHQLHMNSTYSWHSHEPQLFTAHLHNWTQWLTCYYEIVNMKGTLTSSSCLLKSRNWKKKTCDLNKCLH